tara:strand:- start:8650 stop:9183 length:534 start_codon:yes stop_codon:yes gene_type:complete
MYLLKLDRQGDIYKQDDGITGVPEFVKVLKADKLGATALKWIALVCDYDSPYRHFIESERIKAVSKDLYDKYEWYGQKRPEVLAAMDKYKALQFDPLDEQLIAFNTKISQFTTYMNNMHIDEDTAEGLQKIMIGIEKIYKTRQTLVDAIERRGERQKIVGDKKLSFLENKKEMQENV